MKRTLMILPLLLAMAAGGNESIMAQEQYPLVLNVPQDYAAQHYLSYTHDLSPLKEFHFRIYRNKDWHTVNQAGDHLPKPGEFEQIGYFKGPGQEPAPRIYVAVTPMDKGQTPAKMLNHLIHQAYDLIPFLDHK